MKKYLFIIAVIVSSIVASCSGKEYDHFASIHGVVCDYATGQPLSNAHIILSPGGATRTTDADGYFEFEDVTPQQYSVTAQKFGYQSNNKTVTAVVGESVEANIALIVGQ